MITIEVFHNGKDGNNGERLTNESRVMELFNGMKAGYNVACGSTAEKHLDLSQTQSRFAGGLIR